MGCLLSVMDPILWNPPDLMLARAEFWFDKALLFA